MNSTAKQLFYAFAAIAGVIVTWYHNLAFSAATDGFSLVQFVRDNYVNHASASIANDIAVVAVVFCVWSFSEAKQLGMRFWPAYVVATFMIALAMTFPLFLLMRERALQAQKPS